MAQLLHGADTLAARLRRRTFVQGLSLGALGVAAPVRWAGAEVLPTRTGAPPELTGTEFDLRIGATPINITGKPRMATTVNGSLPGPLLRWKEGSTVTLRVTNTLPVTSSIHWHGILLPAAMDGVPGFSFDGIQPGETFVYRFPVRQSGTYWYHSHSGFQEQTGLLGALVIDPQHAPPATHDSESVVMLSDWTDDDPDRVMHTLKADSAYYNEQVPTLGDFFRDASNKGFAAAWARRKEWGQMRMNPTDFSDVSGAAYTYLVNGMPPAANHAIVVKPGERKLLRIINASASSIFDVRIPGLKLTVVAADGQSVAPVAVDELRIATAETYDVLVSPEDRAYTLFAQSIDRMGYARATLAPRAGMTAAVPPLDPATWLSMEDMGMGNMSGMEGMQGMQSGDDMQGMQGMQAGDDTQGAPAAPAPASMDGTALGTGPSVDSRSISPGAVVSDPGPRLRGNGRRALVYNDLRTVGGSIDPRPPVRDIVLRLTGNMNRFIWGFDGRKYSQAEPIRLAYGERVRFVLINDTMMTHPIHLHGMWSEVEGEDGSFLVRKHTVIVHPGKYIKFRVTADARGRWAFHCHLLYHMEAGMFREVVVA
ncbi:copper resistance system multicopper oxidase [Ramlibacter ginsenosidimutans]|uniref:Copper resistance system multicopper oxidase n=1 Tax=Ramlibacter ginsenosidimutans TaxID=502333 RepID=A0A934WKL5_9BURK|nr:copper resistance system multicopper oxidase [Ramlibacter ginsenosidimutans]MBK6004745.1 copper resistance system multicopper oxidase [Ramlibacter ginsenosidimutans]